MKTASVGQLRQNPTKALAEVERGEVYAVTRHSREIARLVPIRRAGTATPEAAMAVYQHSPLADDDCAAEYLLLTELVVAAGRSHRAHILDRMIAATARAHGLTVLTRNVADFKPMFELVTVEER